MKNRRNTRRGRARRWTQRLDSWVLDMPDGGIVVTGHGRVWSMEIWMGLNMGANGEFDSKMEAFKSAERWAKLIKPSKPRFWLAA
jgi:hypothetical protein